MERAVFVYTTYPSIVEAEQAGRALVERRLCACVNIYPGHDFDTIGGRARSSAAKKCTMIIKTRASLAGEGESRRSRRCTPIRRPAILVIPLESVDPGLPRLDRGRDGGSRRFYKIRVTAGRHASLGRARAADANPAPELPDSGRLCLAHNEELGSELINFFALTMRS